MNRTVKSALAIAVTVGIGIPLWRFGIALESDPPPAPPRDLGAVPVGLLELREQTLPLGITVHGNLVPHERVIVSAELTGRIEAVHEGWRPGARFAEGELLVALDEELHRFDLRGARAALEESEAGVISAEVGRERARQSWESSVAKRDLARREEERIRALAEQSVASPSEADRALLGRLDAELAEESARIGRDAAEAALLAARARRGSAEVARDRAEDRLARTRILAPFDGRFVGRPPAVGSFATVGAPLGEIVDVSRLLLSARVPERDLFRLRPGLEARIRFPSTPETLERFTATGIVTAIDAVSDVATRRGTVEIELRELQGSGGAKETGAGWERLPVGLFAEARIEVERREGVLWIDRRQIVWEGGEPLAFVLVARDGESVAEKRRLRFELDHGEGFVVASGLQAGDLIITTPLDRVGDGTPCLRKAPPPSTEAKREAEEER
jgi:RND family efflux transporter MFP subunit